MLATELVGSLLLNTFWIHLLFGAPFLALLPPRILQSLVMGLVELSVIRILVTVSPRLLRTAP